MSQGATTLLGVRIDDVTMAEAVEHIVDAVNEKRSSYIVTPNPAILLEAHNNKSLRDALNASSLSLPDGTGVLFASYLVGRPIRRRVTGVDLSVEIAREAAESGWRVGVWSPEPNVAKRAVEILKSAFLGFNGVAIEDKIQDSVDVLLVGLGAPRQEQWMFRNHDRGIATVMVGVGGSIDLIAGVRPRAPRLLHILGMEWLWRLGLEPRRHLFRVLKSVFVFPWAVIRSSGK